MVLIFFDTEFSGLVANPKLISLGCVDETGAKTFYAELGDTWTVSEVSDFTREAVLPYLKGHEAAMTMAELTTRFSAWISAFDVPVRLVTDSQTWDWPRIQEIFSEAGSWPENLDKQPLQIQINPDFVIANERAFASGLRRHHALDDARANRLGWCTQDNTYRILLDYSRGRMPRWIAMKRLELSYGALIRLLAASGLPQPVVSAEIQERQVERMLSMLENSGVSNETPTQKK